MNTQNDAHDGEPKPSKEKARPINFKRWMDEAYERREHTRVVSRLMSEELHDYGDEVLWRQ
jgi:hypothetical protein